jgi:hypothetical protein
MTGPVLVGALLLVWAGGAKAWQPAGTARALSAAGLRAAPSALRAVVRGLACVDVVVGVAAIAVGGPFVVAMACSYAGFALFISVARWRGWALSSCGCFGVEGARPTVAHLVADVVLCAVSAVAASDGLRPIHALAPHPAEGVAASLLAIVTAGLLVVVLSVLPTVAPA